LERIGMRRLFGVAVAGLVMSVVARVGAPAAEPTAIPADAGADLARALAAAEERAGPAAPELLPILASLAQLRFERAELAQATALRRRSLKIALAAYGSGSRQAAEAMAALARLYIEQHRYLDAEPLALAAFDVLRDRLRPADPALAAVLADRARIALARGDDGLALDWVEQAIAIDKANGGKPHRDRLRVLGAVLARQGKFAAGEAALRQALALDRAGDGGLAEARSLAGLGNLFLRQKRFAEALPPIEQAAAIDQGDLGPDHPLIAEDFRDLGLAYLGLNRPHDAAAALQTAVDLLERGAGRDTPTLGYVELDLARAERTLGRAEEAQTLYKDARRILNAAQDEERDRQRQA
jgi:Tfp pilus assembly protein PilF